MSDFLQRLLRTELGMVVVLFVAAYIILRTLVRANRSAVSRLNLEDLLLGEDDKLSKAAAVMIGSWLLSSWVVIYITLAGKMTAELFGLYCAVWATPSVTKLIVNRPSDSTTETVISSKTVTAGEPSPK